MLAELLRYVARVVVVRCVAGPVRCVFVGCVGRLDVYYSASTM